MTEKIRFFNVSQKDGHIMSMPKYANGDQSLIGELIYAIEKAHPTVAWVQFSFMQKDLTNELTGLKLNLGYYKTDAETPDTKYDSDGKPYQIPKKSFGTDFYRQAEARMGKIDKATPFDKILMAIQGMWVGDPAAIYDLPFAHCLDEVDHLEEFVYKDPRMLVELVERRMVTDIGRYMAKYGGVRHESPSFIVTPEEFPSYIHLPAPPSASALSSVTWGLTAGSIETAQVWTEEEQKPLRITPIMETVTFPKLEEPLAEEVAARLKHLYSSTQRTFEILYVNGSTKLIITSKTVEDMMQYKGHLESVYGPIEFRAADKLPDVVWHLPVIKGVMAEDMPHHLPEELPSLDTTEYSIFPTAEKIELEPEAEAGHRVATLSLPAFPTMSPAPLTPVESSEQPPELKYTCPACNGTFYGVDIYNQHDCVRLEKVQPVSD